jgi:hypothetical protein
MSMVAGAPSARALALGDQDATKGIAAPTTPAAPTTAVAPIRKYRRCLLMLLVSMLAASSSAGGLAT